MHLGNTVARGPIWAIVPDPDGVTSSRGPECAAASAKSIVWWKSRLRRKRGGYASRAHINYTAVSDDFEKIWPAPVGMI